MLLETGTRFASSLVCLPSLSMERVSGGATGQSHVCQSLLPFLLDFFSFSSPWSFLFFVKLSLLVSVLSRYPSVILSLRLCWFSLWIPCTRVSCLFSLILIVPFSFSFFPLSPSSCSRLRQLRRHGHHVKPQRPYQHYPPQGLPRNCHRPSGE